MQILPPSLFHFMCRTTHLDRLFTISSYQTPARPQQQQIAGCMYDLYQGSYTKLNATVSELLPLLEGLQGLYNHQKYNLINYIVYCKTIDYCMPCFLWTADERADFTGCSIKRIQINYLEKLKYKSYKSLHDSGLLQRLSRHGYVKFQILGIPESARTLLAL